MHFWYVKKNLSFYVSYYTQNNFIKISNEWLKKVHILATNAITQGNIFIFSSHCRSTTQDIEKIVKKFVQLLKLMALTNASVELNITYLFFSLVVMK